MAIDVRADSIYFVNNWKIIKIIGIKMAKWILVVIAEHASTENKVCCCVFSAD